MWPVKSLRLFVVAAGVCSALALAPITRAEDASSKPGAWRVSVEQEPVDYAEPYYRAFLTAGNIKLTFLLPQGFHLQGGGPDGRITLVNREGNCSISFAILGSMTDSGQLNPETYRELLRKWHPTGRIVSEYISRAAGNSGPGFDILWKATPEITQCKQAIFIPSKIGVMQFTLITGSPDFAQAKAKLGQILSTITYSQDGKFKINRLSTTS